MENQTATPAQAVEHYGNRYDRMEWAGAFGDLGTLIPFVVAYIGVLRLDPFGVLFAFGASMLICGLYYKTPLRDFGPAQEIFSRISRAQAR